MERIYYARDLAESGSIEMLLFSLAYPNGLTLRQMEESGEGWLIRAAERIREESEV